MLFIFSRIFRSEQETMLHYVWAEFYFYCIYCVSAVFPNELDQLTATVRALVVKPSAHMCQSESWNLWT